MSKGNGLPKSWVRKRLDEVAHVNPPKATIKAKATQAVNFVPMSAVAEEFGGVDVSTLRSLAEVQKGYTQFRTDDVLAAKITPCMENGKVAVVPALANDYGYGSTEFFVIRPQHDIESKWIAHYLSQSRFRRDAQRSMTGSAGQLRVPKHWLEEQLIPVAPLPEQCRIVAKIEELFSDLDAGVAALKRAQANLKRYRAAVLKAAVEGRLTAQWRAEHPNTEPASTLLERILAERRRRWEQDQLAKYNAKGKTPTQGWKDKYREPAKPDTSNLPPLPERWCWANIRQLLIEPTCNGISIKGADSPPGIPALRLNAMTANGFNYKYRRYIPIAGDLANQLAIKAGDLFVSRGNGSLHLVGRAVLAQQPPEIIVFPDTMIRVRLDTSWVLRTFVANIWPSGLIREQVEKRARTTAGIYKISQRDVECFMFPIPPTAEQEQINATFSYMLSQIDAAEAAIRHSLQRAMRLRQSILKRAFEGSLVPHNPYDEPPSDSLANAEIQKSAHSQPRRSRTMRSRQTEEPPQ